MQAARGPGTRIRGCGPGIWTFRLPELLLFFIPSCGLPLTLHPLGYGSSVTECSGAVGVSSRAGKRVPEQWPHQDFAQGEGCLLAFLALADCAFSHGTPFEKRTVVHVKRGEMVIFDSQFCHNGPAYDVAGPNDNGHLRLHMYIHWAGEAATDNTDIIHFPWVHSTFVVATCMRGPVVPHDCCVHHRPVVPIRTVAATAATGAVVTWKTTNQNTDAPHQTLSPSVALPSATVVVTATTTSKQWVWSKPRARAN